MIQSFAKSVINHLLGEAINDTAMTIVVTVVTIKNMHPVTTAFELPTVYYERTETF